jgi:hypothetical protein
VLAFDLKTKARTIVATSSAMSNISGIEPAEPGAYFVSALLSRKLFHVSRDGKVTTLITFEHGNADIGISSMVGQRVESGTLFVPFPFTNSVSAYAISFR